MSTLAPPKPFFTYPRLIALLTERGMSISDPSRAERKLVQLGYYRLSGFWYPARAFRMSGSSHERCAVTGKPLRLDTFQDGTCFDLILARLGLANAKMLSRWLQQISHLRNRCAHHSRIWNQASPNALAITDVPFFQRLGLDHHAMTRLFGMIAVMWFLLSRVAPSSNWIGEVAHLIDSKPSMPGCTFKAMGFADESGFPRQLFEV